MTRFLLSAIVFLLTDAFALAGPYERPKVKLPDPMGYVSDHAKVLEDDWRARIRSVAQDLERKTGVEMVVVTVPTIKPFPSANDYATAIYEKWGIGSTQQEHGILILLAVEERQAAMTLGRQMLPVITPTVMSQIASEYLHPSVELGHFGEGLYRTVVALATHSQDIRVGTASRTHYRSMGFWITLFTSLSAIAFFWWISRPDLRHPYRRIQRGEYWGTGQGGFGSNWGGFGGGTSGEGYR
ncbi:MAG TPA: TPM domain-containing protein [Nitrospira sp.]|nr:TPM domain-containing protein [Nitrospira sp.]